MMMNIKSNQTQPGAMVDRYAFGWYDHVRLGTAPRDTPTITTSVVSRSTTRQHGASMGEEFTTERHKVPRFRSVLLLIRVTVTVMVMVTVLVLSV